MFCNYPKRTFTYGILLLAKFVNKNFQKSPNLVTLKWSSNDETWRCLFSARWRAIETETDSDKNLETKELAHVWLTYTDLKIAQHKMLTAFRLSLYLQNHNMITAI